MTKVLFLLSAVIMLVSAFFAHQNGRSLAAVRTEKASNHRQIDNEIATVSKLVSDITDKNGEIAKVTQDIDVENEKLKGHKLKLAQAEAEVKRLEESFKTTESTMSELKAKLAKLPAGFNLQTLSENLNKMKAAIVDYQTQAEGKKKEVVAEVEKLDTASKALQEVIAKIEARKKAFERNALTGRVVAVNTDWGFVVLDVGEKEAITPDTKLIVIRGTETVGKLRILSVSGQKTVANVLLDTLAPGMTPAPGDRVILENLAQ
jgi:cell shape-determining protein MreC